MLGVIRFMEQIVDCQLGGTMKRILTGAVLVSLLTVSQPASAHHNASAKYDRNKPIQFSGKVTKIEWKNPHIYFFVDVTDASGKTTNYAIENGSVNGFFRSGVKRDSLKIGDTITVSGFLARQEGVNHVNGRNVTFPDGRKVFVGSQDGLPENP
jgi:hypothetical protein